MDLSRLSDEQLQAIIDAGASSVAGAQLDSALSAIHQIESSGASDMRADIVNPVSGAHGSMQVMPDTARDPGFGVRPSRGTPQDDARMGRDYYSAMLSRYGSPEFAAIAYNWGPGNADHWIASGANLDDLPLETLNYLAKFKRLMSSDSSATPGSGDGLHFPGISDVKIPEAKLSSSGGPYAMLGGIGEGFGDAMLGGQALLGRGLQALGGPQNALGRAGDWLVNDARTGQANLAKEVVEEFGDGGWRTTGNAAGAAVPMMIAGLELVPQIVAGGLYGASQGALNDTGILPGAVEGAGFGAGGYLAGKAVGALASAARPVLSRAWHAALGGERAATTNIARELGPTIDPTIDALRANSDELIPGSLPTAAEAGQSPALVRIQRQMQNTADGQVAFPSRAAGNNAARFAEGERVVGANLSSETEMFTQAQAARVAAGQAELRPLTQAQARVMQSPVYRQAINAARASAESRGSTVFEAQQAPVMQSLREGIERVGGTPETIDALKAARGKTADELFAQADVSVPMVWPEAQSLAQKPAFQDAIRFAQRMADNLGEGPISAVGKDGEGAWWSGRGLQYAKGYLDDQINMALQHERNTEARALIAVKNDLVGLMDRASPDYAPARAKFQADSALIDAQQALQTRLNGAVDPLTGVVSPDRLRQTINSIKAEQLKPGVRAADRVSPATLAQLRQLGEQARVAPSNLTGLRGEGQESMRQALDERVRNATDALMRRDANTAASDFSLYLRAQSPSYARYFDEAATTGKDLQSREALHEALRKLGWLTDNASGEARMSFQSAKSVLPHAEDLTGASNQYVRALLADLYRETAPRRVMSAAGSPTAENSSLGGGLLSRFIRDRTSDAAIIDAATAGKIPTAVGAYMVQRAAEKAAARTEKATIDLLLDPKKLARALDEFKDQPTARKAFVDALKHKARGAGRAGMLAVESFESWQQQKKKRGPHD